MNKTLADASASLADKANSVTAAASAAMATVQNKISEGVAAANAQIASATQAVRGQLDAATGALNSAMASVMGAGGGGGGSGSGGGSLLPKDLLDKLKEMKELDPAAARKALLDHAKPLLVENPFVTAGKQAVENGQKVYDQTLGNVAGVPAAAIAATMSQLNGAHASLVEQGAKINKFAQSQQDAAVKTLNEMKKQVGLS
ncbi:hypothetical protein [Ereboglobus luteus]|uniref:Uncharacterized protein n=1 Tax=Ereboglobus luteus TaxID=1796921 RepID=A0A2U8E5C8_9BACT|nr:hypothetical protein [Ereboglobus luteus]AWI10020.1 hypothetical protein CKA38_12840 [Ereboglobus luteus]